MKNDLEKINAVRTGGRRVNGELITPECLTTLREILDGWQFAIDEDDPRPFEVALGKAQALLAKDHR